ncbi:MAG: NUDIX domain-containing protein [Thermoleophilia bacterium]|nr:NUDIX domain-containing protein [Thermoleophilia bacterium]
MHVDERVLAPLRARFGEPDRLTWEGEISEAEHALVTYNPARMHDVTLFITNGERIALIRKPPFEEGVWRPPGGGIKPGEDPVAAMEREALEETGLRVDVRRYLVLAECRFLYRPFEVPWRTHVFHATTEDEEPVPRDLAEIEAARWGTLAELAGPLRARLLATGRAFWRYRVALHDAALAALFRSLPTGNPGAMANPTPIEAQKYLGGIDYPASKQQVVEHARGQGAEGALLQALESIPDREYDGPNAVSAALANGA